MSRPSCGLRHCAHDRHRCRRARRRIRSRDPAGRRRRSTRSSPSTTRRRWTTSSSAAPVTTPGWRGCTSRRASAGSGVRPELNRLVEQRLRDAGAAADRPDARSSWRSPARRSSPTAATRSEAALPAPDVHRRGAVVPAVLRAGRRVRLRRPRHPGRPRRRRVDRQRPEGVEHARPPRRLRDARHPHRSRRAEAQGHDLLRARHARARASRCARCARSPARPSSTRST